MGRTNRTAKKRLLILDHLAEGKSVTSACTVADIARSTYYLWIQDDQDFAAATDAAIEAGTDKLEDEALKRAMGMMGSDTLLIFLLKARRPEKFKDRIAQEHTGKDGEPLPFIGIAIPLPAHTDELDGD